MNRTVLRTAEILEITSRHDEVSPTDLVKITEYPRTGVYDILHTLEEHAMMYRRINKVCYSIGFHAHAIGRSYSESSDLLSNFYQCMKALVEGIGKAVLLGKIDGEKILHIVKCEPKRPAVMTPSIGDKEPVKDMAFARIAEVFTHHEKKTYQLSKGGKNRIKTEKLAFYGSDGLGSFYNIANPIYNFEARLPKVVGAFGVEEVGVDYLEELKKVWEYAGKIPERLGFI